MISSNRKIELSLYQQQTRTKSKIISLLKKYNASMGFNEHENVFEVDLQVKFDSLAEKERFVQAYFTKLRAGSTRHQAILEETNLNMEKNSPFHSDIIRELRNQKDAINSESLKKQQEIAGTVAPVSSQSSIAEGKPQSSAAKSDVIQHEEQLFEQGVNYQSLRRKLDQAIDKAFRKIYSNYRSHGGSSESGSIKIIDQGENGNQPPISPFEASPYSLAASAINPASSDRASLIREINNQIGSYQEHSLEYQKYDVNEVIVEENPSEASQQSEADKKKQQHFKFLQNRLKGPPKSAPRQPISFDEGKFKQFLMLEKKKIDQLFDSMKKSLFTAPSKSKFSSLKEQPEVEPSKWREALSIAKGSSIDQSQLFSKRFYEVFETRIVADNKSLNSAQLVNYFKFLITNAKTLYGNFLKQGSSKTSQKKLKS